MTERRIDKDTTSEIVRQFGARPEMLVQILQTIVMRFGWVSEDTIRQLAVELNLSRADVYGVVTYYHDFRTEPPGQHIVKICQAEACQAMGGRELTDHARALLGANLHATNADVTLEPVYCLGNCACAPAVMINGKTHGRVSEGRFDELVDAMKANN
ncbi:MAG: NAD(P)H-dependent oxidoreductase subunit E [Gammaproteobacteria bacterium]|nr:NAD(P)H-dependent oxidoreductase subunit E [Gammaproteobacteria bacterium]NNC57200.1 formate dehydrogenase [Woeseiaceae bacterium]NNL50449.1 formate dehydrogenase [Woeseiaceae bacterium]